VAGVQGEREGEVEKIGKYEGVKTVHEDESLVSSRFFGL